MRIKIITTGGREIYAEVEEENFDDFIGSLNKLWLTIGNMAVRQSNIETIIKEEDSK